MRAASRHKEADRGFTLMEILFALAIVGTALFILVSAHQTALGLHLSMEEQVILRGFMEQSVALAEVAVLSGELSGGGEFGSRHPGYLWSYQATLIAEETQAPLYHVAVAVRGPEAEETIEFLVFNGNPEDSLESTPNAPPRAPLPRP